MPIGSDSVADKEFMLEIGGKYSIKVADEDDTVGIFKGYCALGGDTAVVIEMENGKERFIPVVQIVFIDVLESKGRGRTSSIPDVNYV